MAIFDFLSSLISPVTDLVGKFVTQDADKLAIKAELTRVQTAFAEKMMDYEKQLLDSQTKIIVSEAQGQSWLQRNWRPLLMLSIISIVVNNYIVVPWLRVLGVEAPVLELPGSLWTLMEIGVGGYVGGRTLEKIAPAIAQTFASMKTKDEE